MRRLNPAALGFVLGLLARVLLLVLVPENYSFDAYQRWAGREHLLVRDWLPGPQLLVWIFAPLGIGAVKLAFAVVGALGAAAAAALAERLAGRSAGLVTATLLVFGPALTWTVVPYQEGLYLVLLLGGLRLALSEDRRWNALGDLVFGALALVRYEGWPLVAVYLAWRRTAQAALATWGVSLWVLAASLGWTTGYAPSPVDYADWNGLAERFVAARWWGDVARFGGQALSGGTVWLLLPGLAGLALGWRTRGVGLLGLALAGQVVATGFWIAGLEAATVRMQVVPGALLAVLSGVAVSRLPSRSGPLVAAGALLFAGWGTYVGLDNASDAAKAARPERVLAEQMQACAGCTFAVSPRTGLGTRDRHDGCEILQGITDLHAGQDFTCTTWPGAPLPGVNHEAVWQEGGYVVREVTGPGS